MPGFSKTQRDQALGKVYYQTKDMSLVDIAKELDRKVGTVRKWCTKFKWTDNELGKKIEAYELNARRKEAEKIGIGVIEQMKVAAKMMKSTDIADQEKGVKLAMKLTGTEVKPEPEEKTELNQMNIYNYHLPHKQGIHEFGRNNDST